MLQEAYVEGLSDEKLAAEIETNEKGLVTYAGDHPVTKELKQDLQQLNKEKTRRGSGGTDNKLSRD